MGMSKEQALDWIEDVYRNTDAGTEVELPRDVIRGLVGLSPRDFEARNWNKTDSEKMVAGLDDEDLEPISEVMKLGFVRPDDSSAKGLAATSAAKRKGCLSPKTRQGVEVIQWRTFEQ